MSSNMIKAYSIAYDTKKVKNLDIEAREAELNERARKLFSTKQDVTEHNGNAEFVQGLVAEDLGELDIKAEQENPVLPEHSIEELKNSLREEIRAEMLEEIHSKEKEILNTARNMAEEIIGNAKQEAETAKEGIFKVASAQGYEEGLTRAKAKEEAAGKELEAKRQQLEQDYEAKVAELEPAFVQVLIELVKKVTNVAYDNHKEVFLYLLETGLGFSAKDTGFDVILNEEDYKKYASLFPKIKEHYKDKYTLEFKKSAELPEGSCKLENENRVIDCGLGVRMNGLLEELSLLG